MKAAEKNVKRKAHYDHLERAVDAEAAKRFQEQTALWTYRTESKKRFRSIRRQRWKTDA